MRPIRLEMQAFGPYKDRETVDFERLLKDGIFLIKGPTGSGKTTIIDAMTFALYGGSSGDDSKVRTGRNRLEEWRCSQAENSQTTEVLFVFEAGGKKYRFIRRLVPKRKNLAEEQDAAVFAGDVFEPLFENPKKDDLNKKACELIGLDKEQFRQVVLLPQGQFERFLTASSDEKNEILSKIFDADKWAGFAENFYKKTKNTLDELSKEKSEVETALAEEGFESLEALEEFINDQSAKQKEEIEKHKAFNGRGMQRELNEDIALESSFAVLHEYEDKKAALENRKASVDEERMILQKAEKAEKIRGFAEKADEEKLKFEKRKEIHERLLSEEDSIKKAEQLAKEKLESILRDPAIERYKRNKIECEARTDTYQKLQDAEKKVKEEKKNYREQLKRVKDVEIRAKEAKRKAVDTYNRLAWAEQQEKDCRLKYFAGIYGEISAELKDGESCPVCGSKEHPSPALRTDDSVTKEALEEKEKLSEEAKDAWRRADAESRTLEEEKSKASAKEHEAGEKLLKAESELETLNGNLIEGVDSLDALERLIKKCAKAIEKHDREIEQLSEASMRASRAVSDWEVNISNAKSEMQTAENDFANAEKILRSRLEEEGYQDRAALDKDLKDEAERNRLRNNISKYDADLSSNDELLKNKISELQGKTEPDRTKFNERQEMISNEEKQFNENNTRYTETIRRLKARQEVLSEKHEHYSAGIVQAETDLRFAKTLRGDTGVGLQRYVLGIMFGQIIGQANEMLKKVHGGRYRLYRSDDKGVGNKKGLELKVHDNRSPEKEGRSVGLLSGGEKFLVSLALSIGMSAVAQKSGVRIEALFIDEGFGSLDEGSIDDAMDILTGISKTSGMIGIISHVQILESNIPNQLEIKKTEEGSHIVYC